VSGLSFGGGAAALDDGAEDEDGALPPLDVHAARARSA